MATSRGRWASPERTVVWTEPPPKTASFTRRVGGVAPPTKVAVVYYLSRNGQLDHHHFMEVAISSPQDGLCLRDVLDRLTVLRGTGITDAYSWSSKRSYRNGYVWHDLTADDPIHPANGNEYVLKGSQLLVLPQIPVRPRDASASSSSSSSSCQGNDYKRMPPTASRAAARRKNWSSFDMGEYRVAAAVQMGAADAATQTDESRRGRRRNALQSDQALSAARTELGSDEISPPPSSSSPDTLETLIQHDARLAAVEAPQPVDAYAERREDVGVISGGRMRASAVLMQLISCGSIPAPAKREGSGPSRRLPRGRSDLSSSMSVGVGVSMEREYFSGSLVETKRTAGSGVGGDLGALKRSSSYNADRTRDMNMMKATAGCNKLELAEEEVDGARARCIPASRRTNNISKKSPTNHVQVSGGRLGNQPEQTALTEEN